MAMFYGTQGSIKIDDSQSKNVTEWKLSTKADVEQIKTIGNFTIFNEKPLNLIDGSLSLITDDAKFIAKLFGSSTDEADKPSQGDTTTTIILGSSREKFDAEFKYTDALGNEVKIACTDCIATDHEFSNKADGIFEESFNFNVKPENVTITNVKKAV